MENSKLKTMRSLAKYAFGSAMAFYIARRIQKLMDENHEDKAAHQGNAFAPFSGFREQARFHAQQVGENMNTDLPVLSDEFFVNKDGLRIHWRAWIPVAGVHPAVKGVVILAHDIAENCSRYHKLCLEVNRRGYAVFALDHQGHGRSEGDRLYAKWFADLTADVLSLAELARKRLPTVDRRFILGIGLGATVAVQVARESARMWCGTILVSPWLAESHGTHGLWAGQQGHSALKLASGAFPKAQLHQILPSTMGPSSLLMDRHVNDPLSPQNGVTARLLHEITLQFSSISAAIPDIEWPFQVVTFPDDSDADVSGARRLHDFAATSSENKEFITSKVHVNRFVHEGVEIAPMVKWMDSRLETFDPTGALR